MSEIVISHKSERKPAARHLANILRCYGYSVWADYEDLSEDCFNRELEQQLNKAKAVLVLWCQHSVSSQWVIEQARMAKEFGRLIPVQMETADLPLGFASTATHDLSDWDGTGRSPLLDPVLEAIADKTGKRPQMDYDALKTYEKSWQDFGAPRWSQFPLTDPVSKDAAISSADIGDRSEQGDAAEQEKSPNDDAMRSAFSEIFGDKFAAGDAPPEDGRGADLHLQHAITLEQAFKGLETEIRFTRKNLCKTCEGNGARDGKASHPCAACDGEGQISRKQGFFKMSQTCQACNGSGHTGANCNMCDGSGTVDEPMKVKVKIPAGIASGKKLKLNGLGEINRPARGKTAAGQSLQQGDLFLEVVHQKHAIYDVDGLNLSCRYQVKESLLRKGGSLKVMSVDGSQLKLNVPKKSEPGSRFRLAGRGMRDIAGNRGDLFVSLVLE